ncbi:MAG: diguanylate cyclase [Treponemataceae bacterium]
MGLLVLVSAIRSIAKIARRLTLLADMNIEINRAILLNEDIEFIYGTILDYLFRIFDNVTYGSVLVLGEDGYLTFAASRGFSEDYVKNFKLKWEDSFLFQETSGKKSGARLISKKTLERGKTQSLPEQWKYKSVLSAPLYTNGQLFGTLNLDSENSITFAQEDVHVVEQFTAQIEVCLLVRGKYRHNIERSRTDVLTGLFTRRYFEELFAIEIARVERYGEAFILALFDADGLKNVNDTLGHQAGDQFLIAIAEALRDGHRKSDIIGRFGGDEYIALYHASEMKDIKKNLSGVLSKLKSVPIKIAQNHFTAAFSFGLAHYPEDGKVLDELIAVADRRLYVMKKRRQ